MAAWCGICSMNDLVLFVRMQEYFPNDASVIQRMDKV
jgi:hypothetical protein